MAATCDPSTTEEEEGEQCWDEGLWGSQENLWTALLYFTLVFFWLHGWSQLSETMDPCETVTIRSRATSWFLTWSNFSFSHNINRKKTRVHVTNWSNRNVHLHVRLLCRSVLQEKPVQLCFYTSSLCVGCAVRQVHHEKETSVCRLNQQGLRPQTDWETQNFSFT